jgi:NADP-dependent 3-hydroxy acid dehydrogenase YdfG
LLVNDVASFQALGQIAHIEPNEWWYKIEANLCGPFNFTQAVLSNMLAHHCDRITSLGSVAELQCNRLNLSQPIM